MVRVQVPVLLSRIQRADSVDVCAGVAAIGLRVAVSQAVGHHVLSMHIL